MPVLRAVDPAAPAVQDEAVGAGVGEGLAGHQPRELSSPVDVDQLGPVQLDRAHDPRGCRPRPPWGTWQPTEIPLQGTLQPGALLAGLNPTGGPHRHGQGKLARTHSSLDEAEVTLDQAHQGAQPGIAPADVFAEDGSV